MNLELNNGSLALVLKRGEGDTVLFELVHEVGTELTDLDKLINVMGHGLAYMGQAFTEKVIECGINSISAIMREEEKQAKEPVSEPELNAVKIDA